MVWGTPKGALLLTPNCFGDLEREDVLPSPSISWHLSPLQTSRQRKQAGAKLEENNPRASTELRRRAPGCTKGALFPPRGGRATRPLPHRRWKTQLQALLCHPSPPSTSPLGMKCSWAKET